MLNRYHIACKSQFSMSFHRRAIPCELCGQNFFPSSLPFHKKQCEVKQRFVEVPCPDCDEAVRNCDLNQHMAKECRFASRRGHGSVPVNATLGGVLPCSVCGRKFSSDRLLKHQVICRKNNVKQSFDFDFSPPAAATIEKPMEDQPQAPLNSNWRTKRDEMKQRMKAYRAKKEIEFQLVVKDEDIVHPPPQQRIILKPKRTSVKEIDFVLVTKDEDPITVESVNRWSSTTPVVDVKIREAEFVAAPVIIHNNSETNLAVLDDSLECNEINFALESSLGVSEPRKDISDLNVSVSPHPQGSTAENTPKFSSAVLAREKAASAWTIDWKPSKPTAKATAHKPLGVVKMSQKANRDPPPIEPSNTRNPSLQNSRSTTSLPTYFNNENIVSYLAPRPYQVPKLDLVSRIPPLPQFNSDRIRFNYYQGLARIL